VSARCLTAVTVAALLCAASWHVTRAQSRPFTPQVDEFVDVYLKHGGDKLTTWVQGQVAPPPDRTLRAFKALAGLTVELVAAEPVIRQPVDLHFDDRGRLWVVQYLQYPFPAGLTITAYDQYLRARYDRVPAPPPNHVRGADKITVLEDKDGDGSFESHQDVITGLNITTSVLTGHGGVWVMNPPYLLFYRDTTGDGLPDGEPEVRLSGFGLEDTHSLANSLTWKTSVLNQFQQSHDVSNLFVVDGSSHVSASCQNPTWTIMALAWRSCDHLVSEFRKGNL